MLLASTPRLLGFRRNRRRDTPDWQPQQLAALGFTPRTVVDVGVGYGTPSLYEAFPTAEHVLIEPVAEFQPYLQAILKNYRGQYCNVAVGDHEGQCTINVEPRHPTRSSLQGRTALSAGIGNVEERVVPLRTLDSLKDELGLEPPFVLKIDAEGAELDVIRGASCFLQHTQCVVAEVSVADRFRDGYTYNDFISEMARRGLRMREILSIARRKHPVEIQFMDVVFTPR